MFLFEAVKKYPELCNKARRALSEDEMIFYLASCTEENLFDFLYKFDWTNTYRSQVRPDVALVKLEEEYTVSYDGYNEHTVRGDFRFSGKSVYGALTEHNHENGKHEYFFCYK